MHPPPRGGRSGLPSAHHLRQQPLDRPSLGTVLGMMPALKSLAWRTSAKLRCVGPAGPSFVTKLAAEERVSRMATRLGTPDPVWTVNDKSDAYAWVDGLGVRRPATLGEYPDVDAVDWDALPDRCVLKPVRGAGASGVHLLQRRPEGWYELRRGRSVTLDEVRGSLRELAGGGSISAGLILEQMVTDSRDLDLPPVDFKVYTFFGKVALTLARAPKISPDGVRQTRVKGFDTSWADLGPDVVPGFPDPSIPPPRHADALLAMAERISAAVPRPFLRVDLYDDDDGPMFGEITPFPGGPRGYRRDIDRYLGECWEEAEARLLVRAAQAGVLDPATGREPEPGAEPVPGRTGQ